MGDPARKIEPTSAADERLAALLALPLRDEPPTEEERAIFAEIEAEIRAGYPGHSAQEIREDIQQMRRDQGE